MKNEQSKQGNWNALQVNYSNERKTESERLTYKQFCVAWELAHSRKDPEISQEEIERIKKEVN